MVPFLDLKKQHAPLAAELAAAFERVLHSGQFILGREVEQLEEAAAALTGTRHAIGVSSGTAGLHCAAIAAGLTAGDEVLTTPFSFVASTNCILYVGAKPGFVDIDPQTLNIDPDKLEAAITPQTRAIVAVETFGHPGGMAEIEQIARQEYGLVMPGQQAYAIIPSGPATTTTTAPTAPASTTSTTRP